MITTSHRPWSQNSVSVRPLIYFKVQSHSLKHERSSAERHSGLHHNLSVSPALSRGAREAGRGLSDRGGRARLCDAEKTSRETQERRRPVETETGRAVINPSSGAAKRIGVYTLPPRPSAFTAPQRSFICAPPVFCFCSCSAAEPGDSSLKSA